MCEGRIRHSVFDVTPGGTTFFRESLDLCDQEGPVISAHSVQVARFLFIDSHTRKGRGTPPKIVEPLNFAPLRYSLNSCLHRH